MTRTAWPICLATVLVAIGCGIAGLPNLATALAYVAFGLFALALAGGGK